MGKYYSQFRDIHDKLYTVDFESSEITGNAEIKLGNPPFVTDMSEESNNIYEPVKSSGATVCLFTNQYLFKLYSGNAKGVKCTLYSGTKSNPRSKTEWTGYVTPCMYDMGYRSEFDYIEVECVDGLGVLKSIPYSYVKKDKAATFNQIIYHCLQQADCFKYFYISDNVQKTSSTSTEAIGNILRVEETNFFDKEDDPYTPVENLAWNCWDVLTEICRYLGYTVYAQGDEVYIVDYDAIRLNQNTYYKYQITTSESIGTGTRTTIKKTNEITGKDIKSSDAKVSLDSVYNKVTVKDEFFTFDDIFPEFGDEKFETNTTVGSDWNNEWTYYYNNNKYYKDFPYDNFTEVSNNSGRSNNYTIWTCKNYRDRKFVCVAKFMDTPTFKFYKYGTGNADHTANYDQKINGAGEDSTEKKGSNWPVVLTTKGATYVRFWHKEISNDELNTLKKQWSRTASVESRKKAWENLLKQAPGKVSLAPMIIMKNDSANHIGRNDVYTKPFIQLKNEKNVTFGGEGAYLLIQGSVLYHDEQNTPFPMTDGADNSKLKRDVDCKRGEEMYLPCRLKWGDQYWDGEQWVTSQANFPLRFGIPNQGRHYNRDHYSNKQLFDKSIEFVDTAQSVFGASEKGVYIPCPDNGVLQGKIEFIIYANRDMYGDSYHGHWDGYDRYCSYVYVLRNFKFKACISNGWLDDKENDSDTVYTNIIGNGAIDEMDEISFKVCTYDNKKSNHSSVDYVDSSGKTQYVNGLYNRALYNIQMQDNGPDGVCLCQENQLVYKLVRQYEKPRLKFSPTVSINDDVTMMTLYSTSGFPDKRFITSTISTDYRYATQKLTLIEKA